MEENQIVGLDSTKDRDDALAERKARLLRQGEYYRVGIVHAKAHVRQGSRPDALLHSALDHAGWALRSRVDNLLRPTGINVSAILPYAVSVLGFINRRRLLRPALGVLAAAAGVAYYLQHRARAPH